MARVVTRGSGGADAGSRGGAGRSVRRPSLRPLGRSGGKVWRRSRLEAFRSPNLLAPLPLPQPSSLPAYPISRPPPVDTCHLTDPSPAGPALQPRPYARPHSQEEAHLRSSEGRGGAAGPHRGQDSEPAREPGGVGRSSSSRTAGAGRPWR
jgi:hypothetical protein